MEGCPGIRGAGDNTGNWTGRLNAHGFELDGGNCKVFNVVMRSLMVDWGCMKGKGVGEDGFITNST